MNHLFKEPPLLFQCLFLRITSSSFGPKGCETMCCWDYMWAFGYKWSKIFGELCRNSNCKSRSKPLKFSITGSKFKMRKRREKMIILVKKMKLEMILHFKGLKGMWTFSWQVICERIEIVQACALRLNSQ